MPSPFPGVFSVENDDHLVFTPQGFTTNKLTEMPGVTDQFAFAPFAIDGDIILLQAMNIPLPVMQGVGKTRVHGVPLTKGKYGNQEALRLDQHHGELR